MLNAIDINQFLSSDLVKPQDLQLSDLKNNVLKSLNESGFLWSDLNADKRMGLFCFGMNDKSVGFFDSLNGKKYLFQFLINENYLMMNQRSAQLKELKYFKHRLSQILQVAHFDLRSTSNVSDKNIEQQVFPAGLIKKLLGVFNISASAYWQPSDATLVAHLKKCLNGLLKKSKLLISDESFVDQKAGLIDFSQSIISSQKLMGDQCVLVTNSNHVNPLLNEVYSLFIYTKSIVLTIKKTGANSSEFKIDLVSNEISFNNESIKSTGLPFLLDKLQRIFNDVRANRAEILEST